MKQHHVTSFWHQTSTIDSFTPLEKDLDVDIAVIGGGIAGIMAAYELAKTNKSVALFEARQLLHGTTGFTTAKLSAQHNLIYAELIQRYGLQTAKDYYQANMAGIETIKQLAKEHQIHCDLQEETAYVYTKSSADVAQMKGEADAYEKLSIPGGFVERLPIDLQIEGAVAMDHQYEFHPLQFLSGMIGELLKRHVQIYENTVIHDIQEGEAVTLTTDRNVLIRCGKVICATHYPLNDPDSFYAKNMDPEISFATAYKVDKPLPGGMYISYDEPRRTFRNMRVTGDAYLLVGGESHAPGDGKSDAERYDSIVRFAKDTFDAGDAISYWSSHDHVTKDRMPFIGKSQPSSDNVFVATGFNKWGLANAVVGAKVLHDLIEKGGHPYADLFDPYRRIPDIEVAASAEDETERRDAIQSSDIATLEKETALTFTQDDKEIGVYRDKTGHLHYLDLTCTHLGCGVHWNDGDKTWDCPCHGSRFNATGQVVAGPANEALKPFKD